jgi:tripartite-type tricarboxylate transporter receptor subunit TctC
MLAFALSGIGAAHAQQAEAWPSRSIRLIVPYAPAGGTDILARVIGNALSRQLGQPVIVENRPGGQTIVGYTNAFNAPADGYTFLLNNSTHTTQPSLYKNAPYNAVKDFRGVAQIAASPVIFVVNNKLPVSDLKGYLAYGKEGKAALNFGSYGTGTTSHLWGEILSGTTGVPMLHVPYRGSAPAIQDLVGGQLTGLFVDPLSIKPFVETERVKAVGITGPKRWKGLENVPTFVEQGYPEFSNLGWFGLFARTGTPDAIVKKMNEEIGKALHTPEVVAKLHELGIEPIIDTPAAFDAQIAKDAAKWAKIIAEKHITVE